MGRVNRVPRVMASLGILLAVSSCSSAAPVTTVQSPPACQKPPPAVLPHSAGSLDETSSGAYCLPVGQTIAVFLHGGASSNGGWAPITSSDPGTLQPRSSGILTAPLGVTPGIFGGQQAGVATLTSSRADGPTWTVTIVVK